MHYSVLAAVVALAACSPDAPSEPNLPQAPTHPLVARLFSEGGTFTMSKLGSDTSSPFLQNNTTCSDGLLRTTEVTDTIFFNPDRSYRRTWNNLNHYWRTLGVQEPEPMYGRSTFEMFGGFDGEGDVVVLYRAGSQSRVSLRIVGDNLIRSETLGLDCRGGRTPTEAVYTRVAE